MNPGIAFVFEKGGRRGIMRLANFEGLVGNHKVGKFLAESPCLGNHGFGQFGVQSSCSQPSREGGGEGKAN